MPRRATGVLERRKEMAERWRSSEFGWTTARAHLESSSSVEAANGLCNIILESIRKVMLKVVAPWRIVIIKTALFSRMIAP